VELSILSAVLALMFGLILALMRQLPGRPLAPVRGLAISYIDVFRGIPLLLVILLINGGFPAVAAGLGLPPSVGIPQWFGKSDPFWYGVMALTITYGAYMAEVYRAGIEAVPQGQVEAARSLGMSHGQAMRHVVVPQAVRKVIPPLLNDFIALMKDTSLVGVIALIETVEAGRTVQGETFNSSALTLGAIMFVVVTIPLARVVDRLIAAQQARYQPGLREA
jgi:polar amino acid transport system permease protein